MAVRSEIDFIRQVLIHSPGTEQNFTLPKNTREWVEDENGKLIGFSINEGYAVEDKSINYFRVTIFKKNIQSN